MNELQRVRRQEREAARRRGGKLPRLPNGTLTGRAPTPPLVSKPGTRRNRLRRFLQAVKLTAGCIDCGYNEYAVALDFDHRDPTTKQFNLSRGSKKLNWAQVIEELMKCDVRCANCHRVKSYPGEVK